MSLCGVSSSVHPCLHHAAPLPFASVRSSTTNGHDACDLSARLPLGTLVCVPSPHSLARARSPLITHTFLFAATMSACKPRLFPARLFFSSPSPFSTPIRRLSLDKLHAAGDVGPHDTVSDWPKNTIRIHWALPVRA